MSGVSAQDGLGPFDPYWTRNVPPPRRRRAWRRRVFFGAAVGAATIGAAMLAPSRPRVGMPSTSVAEPGASVAEATRALETLDPAAPPVFSLEGLEPNRARYEARVAATGGDRRDALSVGTLEGAAPGLRLEISHESGARAALSLYVAAAETAAAAGAAVDRLGAPQTLVTVDGPLEWAELTLAGRERGCAAFRLAPRNGAALRGVVCGAAEASLEASAISCLVEKIEITKAGREAGYADLLGASSRRAACRTPLG
jgi:hypothetical protein